MDRSILPQHAGALMHLKFTCLHLLSLLLCFEKVKCFFSPTDMHSVRYASVLFPRMKLILKVQQRVARRGDARTLQPSSSLLLQGRYLTYKVSGLFYNIQCDGEMWISVEYGTRQVSVSGGSCTIQNINSKIELKWQRNCQFLTKHSFFLMRININI